MITILIAYYYFGMAMTPPEENVIAVWAMPLPTILADVPKVMAACARMVPTKLDEYPIEALVPRAQKTFLAWAPLISLKDVAVAVDRVEDAWNTHWASVLLRASRVTVAAEKVSVPVAEQ